MCTKQKKVSPFATKTLKRIKVNGVKIIMQTLCQKIWNNPNNVLEGVKEYKPIKWIVKTSDGINKTLYTQEEAAKFISKVIVFEKKQLSITN